MCGRIYIKSTLAGLLRNFSFAQLPDHPPRAT